LLIYGKSEESLSTEKKPSRSIEDQRSERIGEMGGIGGIGGIGGMEGIGWIGPP